MSAGTHTLSPLQMSAGAQKVAHILSPLRKMVQGVCGSAFNTWHMHYLENKGGISSILEINESCLLWWHTWVMSLVKQRWDIKNIGYKWVMSLIMTCMSHVSYKTKVGFQAYWIPLSRSPLTRLRLEKGCKRRRSKRHSNSSNISTTCRWAMTHT